MSNQLDDLRFPLANEEELHEWLRKTKFRKQIFGGVSERDVWLKIGELNEMYQKALVAERARYEALLARRQAEGEDQEGRPS